MPATVFEKPAETAKAIKGSEKATRLFLAEHDGQVWATNRFWMVPAERVSGYLSVHNLTPEPGAFDVNGNCSRADGEPPHVGGIIDAARSGGETITPHEIGGRQALVQIGKRLAAIFDSAAGPVACDAQWLEWITGRFPSTYGIRYGAVRACQAAPSKPIAFLVSREQLNGNNKWEPASDEFLGLLMPVRLDTRR